MSAKRGKPEPRRGDVVHVELGEPNDRVKIRLHGHPFTFIATPQIISKQAGPELAELTILADEGAVIDYEALRAVPARRLAYTAVQAMQRLGGRISYIGGRRWERMPGMIVVKKTPPSAKKPVSRVHQAAMLAERALALGQPVRPTVAAELNVSKTTVDRLLKRAKAEGLFEDRPLPKRPPPQQRDTTE